MKKKHVFKIGSVITATGLISLLGYGCYSLVLFDMVLGGLVSLTLFGLMIAVLGNQSKSTKKIRTSR